MSSVKIIIIAGPTASGKSELAVSLAEELNGVVVNADSMQVYKDIPILAAAPSEKDKSRAPHKLYGIYDASFSGNVVEWLELCKQEIHEAYENNRIPIVTGGTGLYLEALVKGSTPIPETPEEIHQEITQKLKNEGLPALYEELKQIDSETAARLSENDTTRIRRAIEIYHHTGKNLTYWHAQPLKTIFKPEDFLQILICPPRQALDIRGRIRFDIMMQQGALEEVKTLVARGLPDSLPAMRALGVQELKRFITGKCLLNEAIETAKLHTRQYAKRQTTWFKNRFTADFKYDSCYEGDKKFVDVIKKQL